MIFSSGLSFPEGPVVLRDGSWLVVEMEAQPGCVTQIGPNGRQKRVIAKTGRPNGLAVDKDGFIWVAESANSALLRMTLDGKVEVIATECKGKPFLWPNDLCFGPDGAVYMTDSGVKVRDYKVGNQPRPDYEKVKLDGRVYRIDRRRRQVRQLDSGLRFTNGIAFGPDGNLYVNETRTGMVYRYCGGAGVNWARGNALAKAIPTPFRVIRGRMAWLSAKMADCMWQFSAEAA